MKGSGSRTKAVAVLVGILLLLFCLWMPSLGLALMALPDIGIDYSAMKVVQAAKLTAAGMADVKNGDSISMRLSPAEGQIIFKNIRTNEEMIYPPAGQRGKER